MTAYFIVPLVARGRTLGALAALQAESGRRFTSDDCALITELAQRAALAIDNSRLYAEAAAALREADRANRANRAKDEFLAMRPRARPVARPGVRFRRTSGQAGAAGATALRRFPTA